MSDLHSSDYATSGSGSSVLKIQNMTSDGLISDWNYLVLVDSSALTSNITVTLPLSTANSIGKSILIKKTDNSNNAICIKPNGSDTIDGSINPIYIFNQNDCIQITSTDNTKCVTLPDNRQGTGNSMNYLKARASAQQTVANNSPFIFNTPQSKYGDKISINVTNGQISLKGGGTYKLTASGAYCNVPYWATSWFENGVEIVGTKAQADSGCGADLTNIIIVSPSVDAVYTYCNTSGGSGAFGLDGVKLYPWVYIEEISRQATVINSVACGLVRYTGTDTGPMANNQKVTFDSGLQSGNMSYSNSMYLLKAGKTYELESFLQIYNISGTTGARFQLWDYTNNIGLTDATGTFVSNDGGGTGYANANNTIVALYKPDTDIQVGIKLLGYWGQPPGIVGSCSVVTSNVKGGTYFKVTQLGNTACTSISSTLIDSQWKSYTPIIGSFSGTAPTMATTCTKRARYKVVGKNLSISWDYFASSSTGSVQGTGVYTFNIPNSFAIDLSLAPIPSNITLTANINAGMDGSALGTGQATAIGYVYAVKVVPLSSTTLGLVIPYSGYVGQTYNSISQNTCAYSFTCEIPIL
jgi:hypothetical protein